MKCLDCKKDYVKVRKDCTFFSIIAGSVTVPNVTFTQCPKCKQKSLTPTEADIMVDFVKKKEKELILKQPLIHFVTVKQAVEILGVTDKAFRSNPKIKRGFIMSAEVGDRTFYLRRSVEMFKKTQDGRYSLEK